MLKKYNVAMFGSGKIAYKISGAMTVCEDRIVRYGVASRNKSHAENFAKTNGFQKVYEDYTELLNDPRIDFVYISTPTEMHYEHMKMCLLAGKNVICEKPFALRQEQAKELIALAEESGLICMDAMWSMYMPMWKDLTELIDKGELGDLKFLSASFGYPGLNVPRLLNKNGGGAFYDLGVYCVTVAKRILGNSYHIMNSDFEWYQDVDIVNKVIELKKQGKIILVFPSGTRYRPGCPDTKRGLREIDSYLRLFVCWSNWKVRAIPASYMASRCIRFFYCFLCGHFIESCI